MALGAIAALLPLASFAQDKFEIQVYDSHIDPILAPRVELHLNYFPSGLRETSPDGELPTDHVARYTLEPQTGLTDCRVASELAPFDHPSLPINNGADLPATGGGSC